MNIPTENVMGIKIWQECDNVHIDVRGLVPPQPMVAILSLLKSKKVKHRLIIHIDREPIYLYPELDECGWLYKTTIIDADYYQIELSKLSNSNHAD